MSVELQDTKQLIKEVNQSLATTLIQGANNTIR